MEQDKHPEAELKEFPRRSGRRIGNSLLIVAAGAIAFVLTLGALFYVDQVEAKFFAAAVAG